MSIDSLQIEGPKSVFIDSKVTFTAHRTFISSTSLFYRWIFQDSVFPHSDSIIRRAFHTSGEDRFSAFALRSSDSSQVCSAGDSINVLRPYLAITHDSISGYLREQEFRLLLIGTTFPQHYTVEWYFDADSLNLTNRDSINYLFSTPGIHYVKANISDSLGKQFASGSDSVRIGPLPAFDTSMFDNFRHAFVSFEGNYTYTGSVPYPCDPTFSWDDSISISSGLIAGDLSGSLSLDFLECTVSCQSNGASNNVTVCQPPEHGQQGEDRHWSSHLVLTKVPLLSYSKDSVVFEVHGPATQIVTEYSAQCLDNVYLCAKSESYSMYFSGVDWTGTPEARVKIILYK